VQAGVYDAQDSTQPNAHSWVSNGRCCGNRARDQAGVELGVRANQTWGTIPEVSQCCGGDYCD